MDIWRYKGKELSANSNKRLDSRMQYPNTKLPGTGTYWITGRKSPGYKKCAQIIIIIILSTLQYYELLLVTQE